MLPLLATMSLGMSRRMTEIWVLVAAIGSIVLAGGGLSLPLFKRGGLFVGGLLLAIDLVLVLVAIHYDVNPYNRV